jgi:hypothetical protein
MKYTGPHTQRIYTTDPQAKLAYGCKVLVFDTPTGTVLGTVRSRASDTTVVVNLEDGAKQRFPRAQVSRIMKVDRRQVMIGRL